MSIFLEEISDLPHLFNIQTGVGNEYPSSIRFRLFAHSVPRSYVRAALRLRAVKPSAISQRARCDVAGAYEHFERAATVGLFLFSRRSKLLPLLHDKPSALLVA